MGNDDNGLGEISSALIISLAFWLSRSGKNLIGEDHVCYIKEKRTERINKEIRLKCH